MSDDIWAEAEAVAVVAVPAVDSAADAPAVDFLAEDVQVVRAATGLHRAALVPLLHIAPIPADPAREMFSLAETPLAVRAAAITIPITITAARKTTSRPPF